MTGRHLDTDEREQIADLLRYGFSIVQVCELTGRSATAVKRIRDEHGIPAHPMGCPQKIVQPPDLADETDPEPYVPLVDAVFTARPNQRQWLAVLAAADPAEENRLWRDIRRALRVGKSVSEEAVVLAAVHDPRSADELAALYLAAYRTRRYR